MLHDNAQETLGVFGALLAYARKHSVTLTTVSGLLGVKPGAALGAFSQVSVDKSVPGH